MIDAVWYEHRDGEQLAAAVAAQVAALLAAAIDERGAATAAFPGGRTPRAAFSHLAAARLDWRYVTLIAADDRLVGERDPLSNTAVLREYFSPLGANVVPLVTGPGKALAAGSAADVRMASLSWPLDLAWVGMGADGHIASIFPGPDLEAALDVSRRRAVGVRPDPLPPEAPVARVTLTRGAIASARAVVVILAGEAKRTVLEAAIAEGEGSRYPIGPVLAVAATPVSLHWSPT